MRGQSALLTAREMEIFEHIFDAGRQGCTMLALCNAIHAERPVGSATPDPYVLVVHISNMRKRLREIGVVIESNNNYRGGKNCRYSINTNARVMP